MIGFLPRLIGFLIILVIGLLVAKALQKLVAVGLEKVGADRALRSGTGGEYVQRLLPDVSPSDVIGRVVFWFVFLGALSIAISSLGLAVLNDFVADVTITYAALMGAVALGAALAFGLGGRDVASRMLEEAYRRGQAERARSSGHPEAARTPIPEERP